MGKSKLGKEMKFKKVIGKVSKGKKLKNTSKNIGFSQICLVCKTFSYKNLFWLIMHSKKKWRSIKMGIKNVETSLTSLTCKKQPMKVDLNEMSMKDKRLTKNKWK